LLSFGAAFINRFDVGVAAVSIDQHATCKPNTQASNKATAVAPELQANE
jgi:hypothetical protein